MSSVQVSELPEISCHNARQFLETVLSNYKQSCQDMAASLGPSSYFDQAFRDLDFHHEIINHRYLPISNAILRNRATLQDFKSITNYNRYSTINLFVDFLIRWSDFIVYNILKWVPLVCDHHCPHYEPRVIAEAEGCSDPGSDIAADEPFMPEDYESDDMDEDESHYLNFIKTKSFVIDWRQCFLLYGKTGVFTVRYLMEIFEELNHRLNNLFFPTRAITRFDFSDYKYLMKQREKLLSEYTQNSLHTFTGVERFVEKIAQMVSRIQYFGVQRDQNYFKKFQPKYVDTEFDHHTIHCLYCKVCFPHCWQQDIDEPCANIHECENHRLKLSFGSTITSRDLFWYRYLSSSGATSEQLRRALKLTPEAYGHFLDAVDNTESALQFHFGVSDSPAVVQLSVDEFLATSLNAGYDQEEFDQVCTRVTSLIGPKNELVVFLSLALSGNLDLARMFSIATDQETANQVIQISEDRLRQIPYSPEPIFASLFLDHVFQNYRRGLKVSLIPQLRKLNRLLTIEADTPNAIARFLRSLSNLTICEA